MLPRLVTNCTWCRPELLNLLPDDSLCRSTRTCSPACGALSQLLCLITHCLSSMPPRLAIKLRAKAQLVGNSQRFNASILAGQELAHAGSSARLPVAVGAQSHSGARSQALKSARTLEGVRPLSQNFLCRRLRRHLDLGVYRGPQIASSTQHRIWTPPVRNDSASDLVCLSINNNFSHLEAAVCARVFARARDGMLKACI